MWAPFRQRAQTEPDHDEAGRDLGERGQAERRRHAQPRDQVQASEQGAGDATGSVRAVEQSDPFADLRRAAPRSSGLDLE